MTLEFAALIEARRQAAQKVKAELRRKGLKLAHISQREVNALATDYLAAQQSHNVLEAYDASRLRKDFDHRASGGL